MMLKVTIFVAAPINQYFNVEPNAIESPPSFYFTFYTPTKLLSSSWDKPNNSNIRK